MKIITLFILYPIITIAMGLLMIGILEFCEYLARKRGLYGTPAAGKGTRDGR